MGCLPLISFDYQGTEPPELSRTRVFSPPRCLAPSMPLTLIGSIAMHSPLLAYCLAHIMPRWSPRSPSLTLCLDASMLRDRAKHWGTMPRDRAKH